jgi:multimeric flavodoxin WrbA
MKVLILHGSPRKGRNSDTLVNWFLKGLDPETKAEVDHFYPNGLSIKPCQGCLYCATSEDNSCRIPDDMQEIYAAYKESDIIVFATPMYWGYLTAQLKTVLDRMEALAWKGFGNKTFAVLITYRFHCKSAVSFFERIAPFFNISLFCLTCKTYDEETEKDIDINDLPDKLEKALELGNKVRESFE